MSIPLELVGRLSKLCPTHYLRLWLHYYIIILKNYVGILTADLFKFRIGHGLTRFLQLLAGCLILGDGRTRPPRHDQGQ